MKFLITGGAGYIGSTIASAMLDSGHTPVILDNLSVGKREFTRGRNFYQADIADQASPGNHFPRPPGYFCYHPLRRAGHCSGIGRKTL